MNDSELKEKIKDAKKVFILMLFLCLFMLGMAIFSAIGGPVGLCIIPAFASGMFAMVAIDTYDRI